MDLSNFFTQNARTQPTTGRQGFIPNQQSQLPAFNPEQFAQVVLTLNQSALEKLVIMARMRGISDADIQAGLDIIQSLR